MKKILIFFFISLAIVIFSIILINTAPVINGIIGKSNENCKIFSDTKDYYNREKIIPDESYRKIVVDYLKRGRYKCFRDKTVYSLEYIANIFNIVLSFYCTLLSFLHVFDIGKFFEKYTGLIGFISGIIFSVLNIVYICFSGYIFTFDFPNMYFHTSFNLLDNTELSNEVLAASGDVAKLDKDGAIAKLKGSNYKCIQEFDANELNKLYARYKDLGKKQYCYNKDSIDEDSKFYKCKIEDDDIKKLFLENCDIDKIYLYGNYMYDGNDCDKLYVHHNSLQNKYNYELWVTSLIFDAFIIALSIGLIIFGHFVFNNNNNKISIDKNLKETKIDNIENVEGIENQKNVL